jgi:hypothetical protein
MRTQQFGHARPGKATAGNERAGEQAGRARSASNGEASRAKIPAKRARSRKVNRISEPTRAGTITFRQMLQPDDARLFFTNYQQNFAVG